MENGSVITLFFQTRAFELYLTFQMTNYYKFCKPFFIKKNIGILITHLAKRAIL